MSSVHEIEAQALSLSPAERAHLVERLLDSFEAETQTQQLWVDEALRREAQVHAGQTQLVDATAALARIRASLAE